MCASERPLPPATCRSSTFASASRSVRRSSAAAPKATTALVAVDEEQAGTKTGTGTPLTVGAQRHRRRRDRKRKRSDGEWRGNANVTGTALGLLSLAGLCCLLVSYGGQGGSGGREDYAGKAPLANLQSAQDLHRRVNGERRRRIGRQSRRQRHRYLAEAMEGLSPPPDEADSSAHGAAAAEDTATQPYGPDQVLTTQQTFDNHHKAALLVFDGSRGAVETYVASGPDLEGPSKRYWPAFLLARALFRHFPQRFAPGSPPFQLLYTTADYPHLNCLGTDGGCGGDGNALAPILSFGSVPRDPTILPTATAMPFPSMAECLVRDCRLLAKDALEKGDSSEWEWSGLRPQILWRGDDYATFADNFDLGLQHGVDLGIEPNWLTPEVVADRLIELWDTLTPSWRAVASSLRARIDADRATNAAAAADDGADTPRVRPWIDAKFIMGHSPAYQLYDTKFAPFLDAGSEVATAEYMGADEMTSYRYHIDIVTGGATSWEDTVRKLALPGLLFHHESLMKDWFYDELRAWEHYVPIRMDLSDLSEKYVWAEQHPLEAQTIAKNGRNFVKAMATESWKKDTYEKLFVNKLGEIVNSYVPDTKQQETLESILGSHEQSGIRYNLYSRCTAEACAVSNKDTRTFDDVQFDYLKDYSWMGRAAAEGQPAGPEIAEQSEKPRERVSSYSRG